ncbi:MAG: hypothetical protein IKO56_09385 [Alphaproteobacteria bacterium]|nr:hypothetical protein [Alphaproteobacteria bacterium]
MEENKHKKNEKWNDSHKVYSEKELASLKKIVGDIKSMSNDISKDFPNWGNHNEYTRGW